jgi:hypothetical protein
MPQRQHRSEVHNGHHLNATAVQDQPDGPWHSQVDVRTSAGGLLPYSKEDSTSYGSADEALAAAMTVGRALADERPDLPENA